MNHPRADDIVLASEHLPSGSTLTVQGLTWEDYETLLDRIGHRPALRVSYDSGKLEILTISPDHGWFERFVEDLVLIFCEAFDLDLAKFGSTTWKKKSRLKGVEPDASYYIRNASHTIGKKTFNLEKDLPPDLFVEIDVPRNSLGRFPTFAALGIAEVWRYDGKTLHIYKLVDTTYVETNHSRFLPGLTSKMLTDAVDMAKGQGQPMARRAFSRTITGLKKKS